ncbi:BrnT family toxin [Floridanema evergladense]|uniref:BrnT family toxin n=1 Tax=Floridaenema evergladense BLCC-F167 TaxID=3153639 RepID=A0ABV4WEE0_9CYAN
MELEFEWDEDKANANFKKHGVRFEKAKSVFNDQQLRNISILHIKTIAFPANKIADEPQ